MFKQRKDQSKRILDRRLARELTSEELKSLTGGDEGHVSTGGTYTFTDDDEVLDCDGQDGKGNA